MKKFMLIAAGMIVLASCGSKRDVEADAKKMCDCYAGANDDMAKFGECTQQYDELKKEYGDDADGLKELTRKVANCMIKL